MTNGAASLVQRWSDFPRCWLPQTTVVWQTLLSSVPAWASQPAWLAAAAPHAAAAGICAAAATGRAARVDAAAVQPSLQQGQQWLAQGRQQRLRSNR